MQNYYSKKLSGERLRLCYTVAPPRIKQYLKAEVDFILSNIKPADVILDLGCGYGRIFPELKTKVQTLVGIDTSDENLLIAQKKYKTSSKTHLCNMDAAELGFFENQFDIVICIQNGISAFKVDQQKLIKEALRVTRFGGSVFFSSYSNFFWENRLEWFRIQSVQGFLGEIDEETTGNGIIICKDGFKATTITPENFMLLVAGLNITLKITEVDNSSIFYHIIKNFD